MGWTEHCFCFAASVAPCCSAVLHNTLPLNPKHPEVLLDSTRARSIHQSHHFSGSLGDGRAQLWNKVDIHQPHYFYLPSSYLEWCPVDSNLCSIPTKYTYMLFSLYIYLYMCVCPCRNRGDYSQCVKDLVTHTEASLCTHVQLFFPFALEKGVSGVPGTSGQLPMLHNLKSCEENLLCSPKELLYLGWCELLHFLPAFCIVSIHCLPPPLVPVPHLRSAHRQLCRWVVGNSACDSILTDFPEWAQKALELGENKLGFRISWKDLREKSGRA